MSAINTDVPVVLLGGQRNTLAVARNLGRNGVRVIVSAKPGCSGLYTKYCAQRRVIPKGVSQEAFWRELLLGDGHRELHGAIVFAMNDGALEFVIANHAALKSRFILDDFDPEMYSALLDKVKTLELARSVNAPRPLHWNIASQEDLRNAAEQARFPVIINPVHTHKFARNFGAKLLIAEDAKDLSAKAGPVLAQRIPFMVVEMVPGPDTNLTGYYTYITKDGRRLYEYTHNVIRRYPTGWGLGCCHHAKVLPDTIAAGRKLLDGINFQGYANVELKKDQTDGQLKVIEVNTRFTAPHALMVRSGMPLDLFVYLYLTGQDVPCVEQKDRNYGSWLPVFDFLAFRELSKAGQMSLSDWLADVTSRRQVLNVFSWSDPQPICRVALHFLQAAARKLLPRKKKRAKASS
jgi:predicted ATP-grasp superfamily ATP-dependent carboligase